MSGHSKWSTIKRQKGANDQARGQVFTKLGNAITIAVREGGGPDPESNFRLRLAIEKARSANMPKDNIDRAVNRATGKATDGRELVEVLYEGFAPGGVAVLAEGVTDNKQRTSAEVKNAFSVHGGTLGSSGSVAYQFTKMGEIVVSRQGSFDDLFATIVDAGAEDAEEESDRFIVYTKPQDLHRVTITLKQKGFSILESSLIHKPQLLVPVPGESQDKLVTLLTGLEELGDIHKVYTNADFRSSL